MATSIITDQGKNILLNRGYQDTPDYTAPSQFKVGINQTTPTIADTDLTQPIPISGTESVDDCETADWSDSADMTTTLNSSTFKEGSNALNLTKDAGAAAIATTDKTTTSRDFTSKQLSLWLYIVDATAYAKLAVTDAVEIRFGSDNSNYYVYTRDAADLAVGWNLIYFTSATADSTTGAPTITACDYSYIGIEADAAATVWSAGDFVMDDWKLGSSTDFLKVVVTGYPTFDELNKEATMRAYISTVEANGYDINGFGWFNTDGTIKMFSVDEFTAESKSSTDEFVFITVDRVED